MRVCACACLFCAHHSKLLFVRSTHASRSRTSSNQGAWPFSESWITGNPSRWTISRNFPGEIDRYSLAGRKRRSRLAELSRFVICRSCLPVDLPRTTAWSNVATRRTARNFHVARIWSHTRALSRVVFVLSVFLSSLIPFPCPRCSRLPEISRMWKQSVPRSGRNKLRCHALAPFLFSASLICLQPFFLCRVHSQNKFFRTQPGSLKALRGV